MKYAKWAGWAAVAAGLLYSGRERLAAARLTERASAPAANAAAPADKSEQVGGFFDAYIPAGAAKTPWIDDALGTVPPPAHAGGAAAPEEAPAGRPGAAAQTPRPFHWLDTHSNPSIVKEGLGDVAHAARGAGVLIDSRHRRWEIEPRRSTAAYEGGSATPDEQAPSRPTVDPAEIARRKDNAKKALECAGAGAAVLLLW